METSHGRRTRSIRYGPDVPTDDELRLLPDLSGKRVLEIGSGSRSSVVAMAYRGAHVIAVDPHPERLSEARSLADDEEVRAEWHESAFEDLAFLRADSVDLAFSAGGVVEVPDLGRLLRQVHRVLKAGSAFVFSYPHPVSLVVAGRGYWDDTPVTIEIDGVTVEQHPQPLGEVFMLLHRSGFDVEVVAEPRPLSGAATSPTTIVWRARKQGV